VKIFSLGGLIISSIMTYNQKAIECYLEIEGLGKVKVPMYSCNDFETFVYNCTNRTYSVSLFDADGINPKALDVEQEV